MAKLAKNKIAILSCIHGNLEALETVLDHIYGQGIRNIACLGDLVGYGPYPNEVVKLIEQQNISTVMGCWDEGIAHENETCGCKYLTEEEGALGALAFGWARHQTTQKTRRFLKALPLALRDPTKAGDILYVHGSPKSTSEYLMESTHELVLFERAAAGLCDILVCGHTHVPFVKEVSGTLTVTTKERIGDPRPRREVKLNPKLIVNAGSVGEPRHGTTDATYVVLDSVTGACEIKAVPYDIDVTLAAMKKKGVPEVFIERLRGAKELTGKDKEISCSC